MPDRSNAGQRLAPLGGALVALLLIIGGWTLMQSSTRSDLPTDSGSMRGDAAPAPPPIRAPATTGSPRHIVVPALSVDAPVDPIRTRDRTLVPPADPQRIGWWADGAKPGDERGTALLTGHTVSAGGGALDDLEDLATGDRVAVATARGSIDYAAGPTEAASW